MVSLKMLRVHLSLFLEILCAVGPRNSPLLAGPLLPVAALLFPLLRSPPPSRPARGSSVTFHSSPSALPLLLLSSSRMALNATWMMTTVNI